MSPEITGPILVTGIAAMIVALVSLTGIWMAKSQINHGGVKAACKSLPVCLRLSGMILVKLAVRAAASIGWS